MIPNPPDYPFFEEMNSSKSYPQYRDGAGNLLPNEDLELREKLMQDLVKKFSRKLLFEGTVRSGTVSFVQEDKTASFQSEIGGGKCIFYIIIPNEKTWLATTGFETEERAEILMFIAENTLRQQISTAEAYYKISDEEIAFFYK